MRSFLAILFLLFVSTAAYGAEGAAVTYQVNGASYEGYYISPSNQAPLVLLIHDWDGCCFGCTHMTATSTHDCAWPRVPMT